MSGTWQERWATIRRHVPDWVPRAWRPVKRWLPPLVSAGLITFLVWTTTPHKLLAALESLDWPAVVGITVVQLVVLFTWDTFCLWWLFKQPNRRVPFWALFRARCDSVLWSAINLEIGQAVFAYKLAKILGKSVAEALGRCVLLAFFDFGSLQALALVGSFFLLTPLTRELRWVPIVSVSGVVILIFLLHFLPQNWRDWLIRKDWGKPLGWWSWRHSLILGALRVTMFGLMLVYAGVGLSLCGVPMTPRGTVGIIPYVLIAESLPGTGGLGERETALVYLLDPGPTHRAVVLSFGLVWSMVTILGRVGIGLMSWALPRAKDQGEEAARDACRRRRSGRRGERLGGGERLA